MNYQPELINLVQIEFELILYIQGVNLKVLD